ncbi:MAG: DedA family protein [Gammaproteobacteria bacterium]
MLTEHIAAVAIKVLDSTHYLGAAVLMALESMIVPLPSEAVMPFVGFQVADGKWALVPALVATTLGSITGSLLSYAMGYFGGRPFVFKAGKYLLLNVRDLERAETFFHKRQGAWTVFIARFVPVVRHFISIPAGVGRMPLLPFCAMTAMGAAMWNGFLLWLGMQLRERWNIVQSYSHQIDIVVVALLLLASVWYVRSRRVAN